jgi:hypothetical protein
MQQAAMAIADAGSGDIAHFASVDDYASYCRVVENVPEQCGSDCACPGAGLSKATSAISCNIFAAGTSPLLAIIESGPLRKAAREAGRPSD